MIVITIPTTYYTYTFVLMNNTNQTEYGSWVSASLSIIEKLISTVFHVYLYKLRWIFRSCLMVVKVVYISLLKPK